MASCSPQLMSWSKTGLLAYANTESPTGNLNITFLETINGNNYRFHPPKEYIIHPHLHEVQFHNEGSTGSTLSSGPNLSNTSAVAATSNVSSSSTSNNNKKAQPQFFYDITSVHWNNWFNLPGDMLAVCDEVGNMTMLILGQSPNGPVTIEKLTMLFQDNVYKIYNHLLPLDDPVLADGKFERKLTKKEYPTTILDFAWLSSSKPIVASEFCVFDSSTNTHRNRMQQIPPYGVFHPPFMKYSCISVRRNGQVDFWYQFSNSKNHKKIILQLWNSEENSEKELDCLQFVKITPINEDQCLLVSTYSRLLKKLVFYKLHVNWNVNTTNPTLLNDPSLTISRIYQTQAEEIDESGNILQLSNIHVASKSPMEKDNSAEIILVYDVCDTQKTICKRFKLSKATVVPEYMEVLSVTANGNEHMQGQSGGLRRYSLAYAGSFELPNKVISLTSELLEGFVTFYFEDGSVNTYSQNDWKPENKRLQNQNKQGKFRDILISILSAGFQYSKLPTGGIIEWARVSPTMCGIIYKKRDRKTPILLPIEKESVEDRSQDNINSTAFAFGFVASIHKQLSSEDLSIACKTHVTRLARLDPSRAEDFITNLMACIYSFFNITPDAPKDILEKMVSSRPVQKAMLLQLELGGVDKIHRNVYQMARIIMSLRNVLFAFNGVARNLQFAIEQLSNNPSLQQSNGKLFQTVFTKQDLVHSLIPVAKWLTKFITYLIQDVITLMNSESHSEDTITLGVLGGRIPRTLLLSILAEIKKVTQLVTKFPETTFPILNESSSLLKMILRESPIPFEKFESFLLDVNTKFMALNAQNPSKTRESTLLVKAGIPSECSNMSESLLALCRSMILVHVDPASVYFADTTGLRICREELFQPGILPTLQPVEEGFVVDTSKLDEAYRTSMSFCQTVYDGISYDLFTKAEIKSGTLKRCTRCGCVTRAGYAISQDKTVIPTSIQTKRWPTMYVRVCICSGYLFQLDNM